MPGTLADIESLYVFSLAFSDKPFIFSLKEENDIVLV
jgi:hypothetical protein